MQMSSTRNHGSDPSTYIQLMNKQPSPCLFFCKERKGLPRFVFSVCLSLVCCCLCALLYILFAVRYCLVLTLFLRIPGFFS